MKTLSDPDRRDVEFDPHGMRIGQLRWLDASDSLGIDTPRLDGVEREVIRVRAQVVTAKFEDDGDIHLVIATRPIGARR